MTHVSKARHVGWHLSGMWRELSASCVLGYLGTCSASLL